MEHECSIEDHGDSHLDPTMSECCRRDAVEKARVEKLKASLRSVDRSMAALDVRDKVFDPPEAAEKHICDQDGMESDDEGHL